MALYGMADNNIAIPAKRDGAIYNAFARNSDFVVEGIGDEFAMTSSTTSFVLTLGTGEGIICGRHVAEVTEDNVNSVLQLEANSQGYVVIRMDLTRPSGSECYLAAVSTVARDNLNDTGTIADLVLYGYVTGSNGVTSFVDMRNIRNASAVAASEVTYSNTSSGLSATNVQSALDEVGSVRNGTIAYVSDITIAQHKELIRVGNIVQCNFRFTVPSSAGSGFTIGTIPNGYRPNVEIAFSAFQAWQRDGNVPIVIETGGTVRFLNTLFTTGQSYYLCATWITTDELPQ